MLALVLAPMVALTAPSPPAHNCGLPATAATANHAPVHARKLGDLPDADMELAVIRSVDGCWVRQVVRFHVSNPAPSAGGEPGAEVPGYTGRLVPSGPRTPAIQRVGP